MTLPFPPVLVITDRRQARLPLEEMAAGLFAGGCRWLSLREKALPAAERLALLKRLVARGQAHGATVTIHDDLETAAACGTGVHLPANASIAEARNRLGAGALIGYSTHRGDEIAGAAAAGADYVTLSPIFLTASKPGYGPALGLEALRRPAPLPVLALGGVDAGNAADCVLAGAAGIAVMGEAMRATSPRDFMADLLGRLAGRLAEPRAG